MLVPAQKRWELVVTMDTKFSLLLFAASQFLLAAGLSQMHQGEIAAGGLLMTGCLGCCCFAVQLADQRLPVKVDATEPGR